ncbi:cellulose biosynthesis cyclic di-GMP-binding regulatory protein BcsB [Devosia sediminis]|uniref:Cyclic di-GMP-binding protein n=1 Tax=Devosia sediminis TaxID=2798801 RepID=A0A934J255_9HYPH|nr:cellulose biosynthesis cyclic di-GMP-binding regulatory protein BcsB [Devosia sediminis]MBJ3786477.1 cellulose biosynthesis cyclic di-GMP-binding regulatory protein BcsB [Devosia sediminis]
MNRVVLAGALLIGLALPAMAQPLPFDMSPESDLVVPVPAPQVPQPSAAPEAPSVAVPAAFRRYLFPGGEVRLEGEQSRQAVVVYLTEAQAAAEASLHFAYVNALVVAPEFSQLDVRVNGTNLTMTPIASSAGPAELVVAVPPGVLRSGANVVDFRASQRHRTDCSIQSTYELWTELSGAWLSFAGEGLGAVRTLADLGAVGTGENGTTTLRIKRNGFADPAARSTLLRAVQQVAIALRAPAINIELVDTLSAEAQAGTLDLVVTPVSGLEGEFSPLAPQAATTPTAVMMPMASGANTLVLSGPNWESIGRAGDALLSAAPATAERPRTDLALPYPLMLGGQSVELGDLGVDTVEFNGRRFTATSQFELPADFYAYRYGTLDLVLDAAFSADVQPGSEIDIFTNGQIASATPLLRTDGGMLRDTVIRIPMTNLRPGRNVVDISVSLVTESDGVCSAGWTGRAPVRFVFSDSTQLRLPQYARAAALPDLRVLTGSGWPYADAPAAPLAVGADEESLLSAMLFLSRVATASGRILPVSVIDQAELSPEQDALLIMPFDAVSGQFAGQTGLVLPQARSADASNREALEQFSEGRPGNAPWTAPAEWLAQRVGMELSDLRVAPAHDAPFPLPARAAVLSQVMQPEGGLWTVLTAQNGGDMLDGTRAMMQTERWRQMAGRVSTMAPGDAEVITVATDNPVIVSTQPFSFDNVRLVAANWFSGNAVYFTAAIIVVAILLMFSTSVLLSHVGRRE